MEKLNILLSGIEQPEVFFPILAGAILLIVVATISRPPKDPYQQGYEDGMKAAKKKGGDRK